MKKTNADPIATLRSVARVLRCYVAPMEDDPEHADAIIAFANRLSRAAGEGADAGIIDILTEGGARKIVKHLLLDLDVDMQEKVKKALAIFEKACERAGV